jgi:hypothetical protein
VQMAEDDYSNPDWEDSDWCPDDQSIADYVLLPAWESGDPLAWAYPRTNGPYVTGARVGSDRVTVHTLHLDPVTSPLTELPNEVIAEITDHSRCRTNVYLEGAHSDSRAELVHEARCHALQILGPMDAPTLPRLAIAASIARVALEQAAVALACSTWTRPDVDEEIGPLTGQRHRVEYFASQLRDTHSDPERSPVDDAHEAGLLDNTRKKLPSNSWQDLTREWLSTPAIDAGDLYCRLANMSHAGLRQTIALFHAETHPAAVAAITLDIQAACTLSAVALGLIHISNLEARLALTPASRTTGSRP